MPSARWAGEGLGVRPGATGPAGDRDGDQSGAVDHAVHLVLLDAVIVGEVSACRHAQGTARAGDEGREARVVVEVLREELGRDGPFGEVVDAPPADAADADDLPDVQQPLDADLVLAPVPPFAAGLGAAELPRRQRAVRLQAVADPVADALGDLVPAPAAPQVGAAAEGEQRPLVHRQDGRGVRPVLERLRGAGPPVGVLDRGAAHRAQARVGHQLVGPGQDGDRVELDGAEPFQHRRHAALLARAQKALGAQLDPACFVRAEFNLHHAGDATARHRQNRIAGGFRSGDLQ